MMDIYTIEGLLSSLAGQLDDQQGIEELIKGIVQREVTKPNDACIYTCIGDFLIKATKTLSVLSAKLVDGDHIEKFADAQLARMESEDGFTDQDYFEYLRDKHASLRQVMYQPRPYVNGV